ncbi:hypothetical protein [Actinomadura rudentiformis]|uniref:Uncharacterized protein n=1 Tax=Actinomadura rudentiformis TaxID=359158 RepID=A0A6H9YRZ8_9ACTN|nr:hypothetical protein [Actinomadura rudentiformis]KAB2342203.1 hypothetical protein F8566_39795 [Actinomadura rudentiformis]
MTDPYDISPAQPSAPSAGQPASPQRAVPRPMLWMLLVISVAGNVVTSTAGVNLAISSAFGLATLAFATALIVQHRRSRR